MSPRNSDFAGLNRAARRVSRHVRVSDAVAPVIDTLERRTLMTAVSSMVFHHELATQIIEVTFDGAVTPSSVTSSDLIVRKVGSDGNISASNFSVSLSAGNTVATWTYSGGTFSDGDYTAQIFKEDVLNASGSPLAANASLEFFFLYYDLSGPSGVRDRKVTAADTQFVAAHLGMSNPTMGDGDVNADGVVTVDDVLDVYSMQGTELATPVVGLFALTATALATGNGVELNWVRQSTANTGFRVQRSVDGGRTFTTIASSLSASTDNYVDTGITFATGTRYVYRVRSIEPNNQANQPTMSRYVGTELTYGDPPPTGSVQIPTGVTVTDTQKNSISIAWNDTSDAETGFNIYRSTSSSGTYELVKRLNVPDATSWTDTGLKASTTYYYKTKSFSATTTSGFSSYGSGTTLGGAPAATKGDLETNASPQIGVIEFDQGISAVGSLLTEGAIGVFSLVNGQQLIGGTPGNYEIVGITGDKLRIRFKGQMRSDVTPTNGGILPNGNYEFVVNGAVVQNGQGQTLADSQHPDLENAVRTYFLLGDINRDRSVDSVDYAILYANYNQSNRNYSQGDLDFDGDVDFNDLIKMSQVYGASLPEQPTTPYTATAGNQSTSSIEVIWTAPTDQAFDQFRIYRSTDGQNFTFAHASDAEDRSWTDTSVQDGTKYWYRVRAYTYAAGLSGSTQKVSATTTLKSPQDVRAYQDTNASIKVSWTNVSTHATQNVIERFNETSGNWEYVTTVGSSATSYQDSGISSGTTYSYRVTATNTASQSIAVQGRARVTASSAQYATAQQQQVGNYVAAPGWLDVKTGDVDRDSIKLTWSYGGVATGMSFSLTRSTDPDTGWQSVAYNTASAFDTDGSTTNGEYVFTDTTVSPGTRYYYRIRTYNAGDFSSSYTNLMPDASQPDGATYGYRETEIDASISIEIDGARSIAEGQTVTVDFSSTGADASLLTSWTIDWGDGAFETLPIAASSATHTYTNGGKNYEISATSDGFASNVEVLEVTAVEPTVSLSGTSSLTEGSTYQLSITLANLRTSDPDLALEIDWGDGSVQSVTAGSLSNGTLTPVSHVYSNGSAAPLIRALLRESIRIIEATPLQIHITPTAASGLIATSAGVNAVDLEWNDNSKAETGYAVQQYINGTWTTIETVASDIRGYQVDGLAEGTTYQFRVQALGSLTNAAATSAASATTDVANVTEVFAETLPNGSIRIHWSYDGSVATSFRVDRSTDGETWTTAATLSAPATTADLSTLSANTDYFVRVVAIGPNGQAVEPPIILLRTNPAVPLPNGADSVAATVNSTTQITIAWTDNATDETGFRVERRVDEESSWTPLTWINTQNVVSHIDSTVSAGHTYYYRVVAFNTGGDAQPSDFAAGTTSIAAPTTLTAATTPGGSVRLQWQDVTANELGFDVYRTDNSTSSTVLVSSMPFQAGQGTIAYLDEGAGIGTSYTYFVKAAGAGVQSIASNSATITPTEWEFVSNVGITLPETTYELILKPAGSLSGIAWLIDWGDGNESTAGTNNGDGTITFSHTFEDDPYADEHTYTVKVSATRGAEEWTPEPRLVVVSDTVGNLISAPPGTVPMSNAKRLRIAAQAFEEVYNTIRYEVYSGARKGGLATLETKSGNDWDQALALKHKLDYLIGTTNPISGLPFVQFRSQRITVDKNVVKQWLGLPTGGTTSERTHTDKLAADLLWAATYKQGLEDRANLVVLNGDRFTFWYTYVHLDLPVVGGTTNQSFELAPAWKFLQTRKGVGEVGGTDGPGQKTSSHEFGLSDYLASTGAQSPMDWYTDAVAKYLRTTPSLVGRVSLADVSPLGAIRAKSFPTLPSALPGDWRNENNTAITAANYARRGYWPDKQTTDKFTTDLLNAAAGTFSNYAAQLRIGINNNTPVTVKLYEIGMGTLNIRFSGGTAYLDTVNASGSSNSLSLGSVSGSLMTLYVEKLFIGYAPDVVSVIGGAHNAQATYSALKVGDPLAILVDVNQISAQAVGRQQEIVNGVANGYAVGTAPTSSQLNSNYQPPLLGLAALNYAHRINVESQRAADMIGVTTVTGLSVGLVVGVNDPSVDRFDGLSNPYVFFNNGQGITYDLRGMEGGVSQLDIAGADQYVYRTVATQFVESLELARNRQLLYSNLVTHNASWLESAALEEITSIESVSTIKGMKWARKETPSVHFYTFKSGVSHALENANIGIDDLAIVHYNGDLEQALIDILAQPGSEVYVVDKVIQIGEWTGAVWLTKRDLLGKNQGQTYPVSRGATILPDSGRQAGGGSAAKPAPEPYQAAGTTRPVPQTSFNFGVDTATVGDPVNLSSGAVYHDETDVEIPLPGMTFSFSRHYESQLGEHAGLGRGWTFAYSDFLRSENNRAKITWFTSSGQQQIFTKSGNTYQNPSGVFGSFNQSGNEFIFIATDGAKYTFIAQGDRFNLASTTDRNGNRIEVVRSSDSATITYKYSNTRVTGSARTVAILRTTGNSTTKYVTLTAGSRVFTYRLDKFDGSWQLRRFQSPQATASDSKSYVFTEYDYHNGTSGAGRGGMLKRITRGVGDPANNKGRYRARHEFDYFPSGRASRTTEMSNASGSWQAVATEFFNYDQFTSKSLESDKPAFTHSARHIDQNGNEAQTFFDLGGMVVAMRNPDGSQVQLSWYKYKEKDSDVIPLDLTQARYMLKYRINEVGLVDFYQYDDQALTNDTPSIGVGVITYQRVGAYSFNDAQRDKAKGGVETVTKKLSKQSPATSVRVHLPEQITVNGQRVTKYTYDTYGNALTTTTTSTDTTGANFLSVTGKSEYDNYGRLKFTWSPRAHGGDFATALAYRTEFTYDDAKNGQLATVKRRFQVGGSEIIVASYTYDTVGNLTGSILGNNDSAAQATDRYVVTRYEYDALQRKTFEGIVSSFSGGTPTYATRKWFTYFDDLLETTRESARTAATANITTSFAYDLAGRLLSATTLSGKTTFNYDAYGNQISVIDALSNTHTTLYDSRNRPIATLLPDGSYSYTQLDGAGRTTSASTPFSTSGNTWIDVLATAETEYNQYGLATKTTQRTSASDANKYQFTTFEYNRTLGTKDLLFPEVVRTSFFDSEVSLTEPWNVTRVTGIDALGRTRESRSNTGEAYRWEYDEDGNLIKTTRYNVDGKTQYLTDSSLKLESLEPWRKLSTIVTYDTAGRAILTQDAAGNKTRTFYDALGRVTDVIDPRQPSVANLSWNVGQYGDDFKTSYRYDAAGRQEYAYLPNIPGAPSRGYVKTGYFDNGAVKSVRDANGNYTTYEYDYAKSKTTVTDAKGKSSVEVRDPVGNVVSTRDRYGKYVTTTYDAVGRKKTEYVETGEGVLPTTRYAYSIAGDLVEVYNDVTNIENAVNTRSTYSYDLLHRVLVSAVYDTKDIAKPYPNTDIDSNDDTLISKTESSYLHGDLVSTKSFISGNNSYATAYDYDRAHRQIAQRSSDKLNTVPRPATVADDYVWAKVYSSLGTLTEHTQYSIKGQYDWANKVVTTYTYDNLGRIKSVQGDDPDDRYGTSGVNRSKTEYEYDAAGNQVKVKVTGTAWNSGSPANNVTYTFTQTDYDLRNRVTHVRQAQALNTGDVKSQLDSTRYAYDENGNVKTHTDAQDNIITYAYDELNRVKSEVRYVYLNASETNVRVAKKYEYDLKLGSLPKGHYINLVQDFHKVDSNLNPIDSNVKTIEYELNGLGQTLVERWNDSRPVDSVLGPRTTFEATTANTYQRPIRYQYDGAGRLVTADSDYWEWIGVLDEAWDVKRSYDAAGNVTAEYQGSPHTWNPTPDYEQWRFKVVYSSFDFRGNAGVAEVLYRNGAGAYKYDSRRKLSYDFMGRLWDVRLYGANATATSINSSQGRRVELKYYQDGSLLETKPYNISSSAANGVAVPTAAMTYRHNPAGQLDQIKGGATRFDYERTQQGQVKKFYVDKGMSTQKSYDYTYFNDGQVKSATPSSGSGSGAFTYDDNQNRTDNGKQNGADNRIKSDANWVYSYDPRGNTVLKVGVSGSPGANTQWIYTYDFRNRLTKAENKTTSNAAISESQFVYDALDRRVEKRFISTSAPATSFTERYAMEGSNVLLVTTGGTAAPEQEQHPAHPQTPKARYLYGPGADQVLGEEILGAGNAYRWLMTDQLGSVRRVLADNGTVIGKLDYDTFGVASVTMNSGKPAPRHQYTGQQADVETGLGYFDARYYQADVGRFINQDPIRDGANWYAYVGNDPVNYSDPTGLKASFSSSGGSSSLTRIDVKSLFKPIDFTGDFKRQRDRDRYDMTGGAFKDWMQHPKKWLMSPFTKGGQNALYAWHQQESQRKQAERNRPSSPMFDSVAWLQQQSAMRKERNRIEEAERNAAYAQQDQEAREFAYRNAQYVPDYIPLTFGETMGALGAAAADNLSFGLTNFSSMLNARQMEEYGVWNTTFFAVGLMMGISEIGALRAGTNVLRHSGDDAIRMGMHMDDFMPPSRNTSLNVLGRKPCFVAGTLVLMADGSVKAIEDVEEGDWVLADDPEDGEAPAPREVTAWHLNWTEHLTEVFVDADGDDSADGSLEATREHPFWTQNRGWVDAKDLSFGDVLVNASGETSQVTRISSIDAVEPTFNLSVEGVHTFFVMAGGESVLVHNTSPGDRMWVVYQANDKSGMVYTGRASAPAGMFHDALDVVRYRYGGLDTDRLRGLDIKNATIRYSAIGNGTSSPAYQATRGLEQLWEQRARSAGMSLNRINPISPGNDRMYGYLAEAYASGAVPC